MVLLRELSNAAKTPPLGMGMRRNPHTLASALASLPTASRSVTPRLKSRMPAPGSGSSTASMSVSSAEVAARSAAVRRQAAGGQGHSWDPQTSPPPPHCPGLVAETHPGNGSQSPRMCSGEMGHREVQKAKGKQEVTGKETKK